MNFSALPQKNALQQEYVKNRAMTHGLLRTDTEKTDKFPLDALVRKKSVNFLSQTVDEPFCQERVIDFPRKKGPLF